MAWTFISKPSSMLKISHLSSGGWRWTVNTPTREFSRRQVRSPRRQWLRFLICPHSPDCTSRARDLTGIQLHPGLHEAARVWGIFTQVLKEAEHCLRLDAWLPGCPLSATGSPPLTTRGQPPPQGVSVQTLAGAESVPLVHLARDRQAGLGVTPWRMQVTRTCRRGSPRRTHWGPTQTSKITT